jgi:penicillin G amidase
MAKRGWKTWTGRAAFAVLLLAMLAALAGWLYLRASLAQLDGERIVPGLHASVTVARDERGVPMISGADRGDLAYATGFVHAQERFFQMDLLRRSAAGELAELFGPRAVELDKAHRLHRFRARAARVLASLPDEDRAFIARYVAGVNAGLDALHAKPFEYVLTGSTPRPWSAADSLLAVWAMYLDLQGNAEPRELARGWLREHCDDAQLAFLLPQATRWDSTLDGPQAALSAAPIPASAPAWWGRPGARPTQLASADFADAVGSNNYALAGSRTASGAAIVSDDMHLGLQLPNTWYRLALRMPDGQGGTRRVVGLTLPGAPPLVIVGSNGHVAWSFTNSYGDYLDLVGLATDGAHPGQVRTPAGWETPAVHEETILVKGAPAVRLAVRETGFGPIIEAGGRGYALHWIAHDPAALNLNHRKLESARSVDEALAIAATDGIPAQNFVAGDERGNIGWTISGILPERSGEAATGFPVLPGGTASTWSTLLPAARYPRVINPAEGQLSSANSRQLMGEGSQLIGDVGFDIGARNGQLRADLLALGAKADVPAAYGVALDDRALFIAPWRERALKTLDGAALAGHPARAEFRRLLETSWDGHAGVDSVGYRLARGYMWTLHELLFGAVDAQLARIDPKAGVAIATTRWPEVVARLLDARPAAWLPGEYASWRSLELAAVDRLIGQLTANGHALAGASWGVRNTADIAHPISKAVPALRPWLAAPPDPLPGDANMPRVAGPKFGQSERMTVSPGREEEGLFDMPGGQSGHPLSPFFLNGHEDWVHGKAVPLLPGPAKYTLTFRRP